MTESINTDSAIARAAPCTLCSGHYHLGVGALANSLYRNGFRGTMYVGYRPPVPPWAAPCEKHDNVVTFDVARGFSIKFLEWPALRNFAWEKANFLLHVFDHLAPEAEAALFFDADVVVRAEWRFFEDWVIHGAALCLDVCFPIIPAGHPWRHAWRTLAIENGRLCRDLDYYFNSGFVGVSRANRELVTCWAALIDAYLSKGGGGNQEVKFGSPGDPFRSDQDILNAAAMATMVPLSVIGQDGMDFVPAGFLMSHAVEEVKPWCQDFIRAALGGTPPSRAAKAFWEYADGPISLFSARHLTLSRAALKIAGAIGRFYSRN